MSLLPEQSRIRIPKLPRSCSFNGELPTDSHRKDNRRRNMFRKFSADNEDDDMILEEKHAKPASENDEPTELVDNDAQSDEPLVLDNTDNVIADYFAAERDPRSTREQFSTSSLAEPVTLEPIFKWKQSDNAVRCLSLTRTDNAEPVIISCAGCYGDNGDIIQWKYDKERARWYNIGI
ncbi:uncharacterized protein LOC102807185 [Saccoglossus kowalevskii]|uniref:Uncharacterized protein LOC102807185 n=1 Tax=Saccoglossus kowalevskii TaxID=10224 RepID=A0ABM0MFB9_SACKO|nr:PREDICTED: uncharacterized protein LOC102807185 [Saccoglossus kowalevskii]